MGKVNSTGQPFDRIGGVESTGTRPSPKVETDLAEFETAERARLGLETAPVEHWYDPVRKRFTKAQRAHTTLLFAGLTVAQDRFIAAALRGLGYRVKALDCPDNKALNLGKEYGNRGQCNPTYYTVGNLLKYLHYLRDVEGLSRDEITENYLFVTAGSCGPCRFGMYATEYRKALRDAGFDGFRVISFQQQDGLRQTPGNGSGLVLDPAFFIKVIMAEIAGDVLNALGYRIRPFELDQGATDAALQRCQAHVCKAFEENRSVLRALWRCRGELRPIRVDRTQAKPRVAVIGEFWAMTTEGEGNYRLQHFLEAEGAEVEVQQMTAWLLYMVWARRYDTRRRENLRGVDRGRYGLAGRDARKIHSQMWLADKVLRGVFQSFALAAGLKGFRLPDLDEVAEVSHRHYDVHLRGGEGHMEVGKTILNVIHNKVNMTLSVKPFGCMPSSGVSDGVQSLVTELYPGAIFLPIETTGDGAINVYSRIQMRLFKARQAVQQEIADAFAKYGIDDAEFGRYIAQHPKLQRALHRSPHRAGSTSADLVHECGRRISWRRFFSVNRWGHRDAIRGGTTPPTRQTPPAAG